MKEIISITGLSSVSSLGSSSDEIWENYLRDRHSLTLKKFKNFNAYVGAIPEKINLEIDALRDSVMYFALLLLVYSIASVSI